MLLLASRRFRSFLVLFSLLSSVVWSPAAAPAIFITNLPAYGSSSSLAGFVQNVNPAAYAVAPFIYVPGYGWVTKPTCAQPLITIQANGSWSANIDSSGGDVNATRIAALLVPANYNQSCVDGLANLPTNIYALAVAKVVVTRPSPGVRFISFAGYDWSVKTSTGTVGPGPNYFFDDTNNVWTDTNGWLHLRITHRTNAWECAEILSARTFGPGSYRFELNSPVDSLNPNVTLGLFTWSDDPAYTDREIDVEGGRWNVPADVNNAQFVVQPYNLANHLLRYRVPPGLADSTHLFVWETNRVSFQCQSNAFSAAATNQVSSSIFSDASAVPQSGDETVHLNLWLYQGSPPSDSNEVEVVVKNFSFVPLGTPAPATFNGITTTAGQFRCALSVQPDYHYALQASSNLAQWSQLATFLATNLVFNFTDTNLPVAGPRFYRAVTLP